VVQGRILGDAIDRPLFPCLVLVLLGELIVVMAMGAIGLGGAAPAPS
jgi:hypothetical protein